MNCPNCNRPVGENQTVCEHCGKSLLPDSEKQRFTLDEDFVFSHRDTSRKRRNVPRNVFIVLLAALVVCAAVLGVMWFMRRGSTPATPAVTTTAPETTVAATAAPPATTVPATTVAATTVPATTVPAVTVPEDSTDEEEKLAKYIGKTALYNTLVSAVDGDTKLNLVVDDNTVLATYRVQAEGEGEETEEYLNSLESSFDEVCARLDGYVYEMKEKSGVSNAEIQITAVDQNGRVIFSQIVD